MPEHPRLYIVLPAWNEEKALRQLVPDLDRTLKARGLSFTICVVDDGSRDGTAALLQSLAQQIPLQHLRHETNQGYGAALKTGFLWVIRNGQPKDVLISLDADNTHPPEYIPDILKKLQEGYDVVTASYTLSGGSSQGVPFKRRVLSWGANTLLQCRFRIPGARTYTNGFRGYRVGALQRAYGRYGDRLVREANFAGGTELFIKTSRAGARVGEVPFTLQYDRRGADSKIRIGRTALGYLKLLWLP